MNKLTVTLALVVVGACTTSQTGSQSASASINTLQSLGTAFMYPQRTATDGMSAALAAHSVIPDSAAASLTTDSAGHLIPQNANVHAGVALATTADGWTTLSSSDGKMQVSVALRGAKHVTADAVGGNVVYLAADSHGGHFVQTVIPDGIESFVSFPASPGGETIFDIGLDKVQGLRVIDNVVEFLDAKGDPRLRMAAPTVTDSQGHTAEASISVSGCSYDDSPVAPWGRKVTAAGASTCAVHVSWSDVGLAYPVLLDPSWTTTGSMSFARRWHGAVVASNMKVLAVGGEGVSAAYLPIAELYNAATGTWAATGRLRLARRRFSTLALQNGKILVAGGEISTGKTNTAELYDPSSGTWTLTGAMATARAYHDAAMFSSTGKVLVAGGVDGSGNVLSSTQLYDPAAGTWSTVGSLQTGRRDLTLSLLPTSGKVLAAGGLDSLSNVLGSAEVYDPTTGVWSPTGSLGTPRHRHNAVVLDDERVLLTGGYVTSGTTTPTGAAEVYDWSTNSFIDYNIAGLARADHATIVLPAGEVRLVGGSDGASPMNDTTNINIDSDNAAAAETMLSARSAHTATIINTGYILVAGGLNSAGAITNSCETQGPLFTAYDNNGYPQTVSVTAASGSWLQGSSMMMTINYGAMAVNATFDWLGTSLRLTVTNPVGSLLGTVVMAHMGDATFSDALGNQQTENRNLVTASHVAFMPPQVVMTGDLRVMKDLLIKLVPVPVPWWLNEWLFTTRADLSTLAPASQQNLWNAITQLTTNSLTGAGVFEAGNACAIATDCPSGNACINGRCRIADCSNGFKVHTAPSMTCSDGTTMCHVIAWQDTVVPGNPAVCVDFVREHYEVDHTKTPQFFQHHRRWLDRIEAMISKNYPGLLPYGYMPYWDSSVPIPTTFTTSQAPTLNCFTYTNSPAIPIATVESLSVPSPGCNWKVTVLGGGSSWCNATTSPNLPYPNINNPTNFCAGSNTDWFTSGVNGAMAIHDWHDLVHVKVGGSLNCSPDYFQQGSFATLDSPGSPLFYPWHAWVDHLFGKRCDCGQNNPNFNCFVP